MTQIGFILTLIFIVLKAVDVVDFTWLQTFLPLIIGVGIDVFLYVVFAVLAVILGNRY